MKDKLSKNKKLKGWEKFEINSTNYLNEKFGNSDFEFERVGGKNSTETDIKIYKKNNYKSNVEAKMSGSQAAQIVVLIEDEKFKYSDQSKSPCTPIVQAIINHLNKDFKKYSNSEENIEVDIDEELSFNRIKEFYTKVKPSPFIITGNNRKKYRALIKLDDIKEYFSVKCVLRPKRSGTNDLPKKYRDIALTKIKTKFDNNITVNTSYVQNKKLFIELDKKINNSFSYIECDNITLYLSHQDNTTYEVRKRSDTNNPNILFTLKLKCPLTSDIGETEFRNFLKNL